MRWLILRAMNRQGYGNLCFLPLSKYKLKAGTWSKCSELCS